MKILTELKQKAKAKGLYKATNAEIISWKGLEDIKERCMFATIAYTCRLYAQWRRSIDEDEFASLSWLAHNRAVDSWDFVHPYAGWYGMVLTTECNLHVRGKNPIWVPMLKDAKEIVCIRPDGADDAGEFWDSVIGCDDELSLETKELLDKCPLIRKQMEGFSLREMAVELGLSPEMTRRKLNSEKDLIKKICPDYKL